MNSAIYLTIPLYARFHIHTELLEKKTLPTLEDIMLKRDKEETFFVFADSFLSRVVGVAYWRKHCAKMTIRDMATILDEAFALLLLENYWESWSTKNVEEYKTEVSFDESTNQKRKGKQLGVNTLVVPGVPNGLGDGQRIASCDSINCTLKYKKIEKRVMQFMWKKGIGCVVLTTHPEKEKGLFMIMNSLSKLTTLMTYCADKFLFLALTFYILKQLFSSELASLNVNNHGYF